MTHEQKDRAEYLVKLTNFYENRWQTDLITDRFVPNRELLIQNIAALKHIRGVLTVLLAGKLGEGEKEEVVMLRGMEGRLGLILDSQNAERTGRKHAG